MRSMVRVTVSVDVDVELEVEHAPDQAAADLTPEEQAIAIRAAAGQPGEASVSRVVYLGPVVEP